MPAGFNVSATYGRVAGVLDLYLFTPASIAISGALKVTTKAGIFTGNVLSYQPGVGQVGGHVDGVFVVTDASAGGAAVGTEIPCKGEFTASKLFATVRLDAPGKGVVIDEIRVPYQSGNLIVRMV